MTHSIRRRKPWPPCSRKPLRARDRDWVSLLEATAAFLDTLAHFTERWQAFCDAFGRGVELLGKSDWGSRQDAEGQF